MRSKKNIGYKTTEKTESNKSLIISGLIKVLKEEGD